MTGEIGDITRMCQYSGSVKAGDPQVKVVWDTGSNPGILALDEILKGLEQLGYHGTKIVEVPNADSLLYYFRLGEEGPFEIDVREMGAPAGNEVLVRVRLAKSPC
ncbi:MAG TPA: hypothetical protein PKE56_07265 [Acidimicrobiales bacterium]|nr:hypothetical protein [Acidimicrobiales bacterium]